jgi:hypothetical protein
MTMVTSSWPVNFSRAHLLQHRDDLAHEHHAQRHPQEADDRQQLHPGAVYLVVHERPDHLLRPPNLGVEGAEGDERERRQPAHRRDPQPELADGGRVEGR